VLFLDELPEFPRVALETLRQPMEEGAIRLVRARTSVHYPARFLLLAAMNPCPCGYLGDPRRPCGCPPGRIDHYRSRVSGPLLDRIDLQVWLPALTAGELAAERSGESSQLVRERVLRARSRQAGRASGLNGTLAQGLIERICRPDARGRQLLARAIDTFGLSARAYHRILRVARTIADLSGSDRVLWNHVSEAIQYRILDRDGRETPGGATPKTH